MTKKLDLTGLNSIADNYDLFYIDLWGVIHNGIKLHKEAITVLKELSKKNKSFVLLTNAPTYITSKDFDHADHIEELKNIILEKVHVSDAIKDIKAIYFAEQIAKTDGKKTNS